MRRFTIEEMANGYVDMGDINLAISQEYFEVENQAMRLGDAYDEVDKKKSEGDAQ